MSSGESRLLKALGEVGSVTKGLEDALFAAVEGEVIVGFE
jgi:hypothetical protein